MQKSESHISQINLSGNYNIINLNNILLIFYSYIFTKNPHINLCKSLYVFR